MKPKSLGLLAVGLLAGPTASDAACVYAAAGVLPVTPIGAGGFEFAPARTNLFGTGIRFEFQTAVTDTCGR
jgi:hypothetical protein